MDGKPSSANSPAAVDAAARREALFREVNERIAELQTDTAAERAFLVCECSDDECTEEIEITAEEYEAVRKNPSRFVVSHGHHLPAAERIVEKNDRYVVVEKIGRAGAIARSNDPRVR